MTMKRNGSLALLLLMLFFCSCRDIRIRDLTGRIVLPMVKESSDTVDFYIKEIQLIDVERLKAYDFWSEDYPGFILKMTITSKLDKNIYLLPSDWGYIHFIGTVPPELRLRKDTLNFVSSYNRSPILLPPKSSVDLEIPNFSYIDERLFDLNKKDNTGPLLDLIQQMKFYYAPLPEEIDMGDTVVINKNYRLRTDANTKITSWSLIR